MKFGDIAPNFRADSTIGPIDFYEWIGQDWCLLFSHAKDFTPVCTTELGAMARRIGDFQRRGVTVIGLGTDSVDDHRRWSDDIEETQGARPAYPIIADTDLAVAKLYDMLPSDASLDMKTRTAQDLFTVRSTFVISPDRRIQLSMTYPMSAGRNVDELLRVIDSIQLTAKHKVGTPAGWHPGEPVFIMPSVPDSEARQRFPDGWQTVKPYMRIVGRPL
jgi:alkyl hydroperoxide reductase subunit AhpC